MIQSMRTVQYRVKCIRPPRLISVLADLPSSVQIGGCRSFRVTRGLLAGLLSRGTGVVWYGNGTATFPTSAATGTMSDLNWSVAGPR